MPYTWDTATSRYRNGKGKFTSPKQVKELAQALIDGSSNHAQSLADQYNSGKLKAKEFGDLLKGELKKESIRQYTLARGGVERMEPKDWGSIGGSLSEQHKYLAGFIDDIDNLSELEVSARTNMYINSTRESYGRGQAVAAEESEYTQEKWTLGDGGKSGENCPGCVELADMGWVDIGELDTVPGAGDTECLTECTCTLEYR